MEVTPGKNLNLCVSKEEVIGGMWGQLPHAPSIAMPLDHTQPKACVIVLAQRSIELTLTFSASLHGRLINHFPSFIKVKRTFILVDKYR